MGDMNAALLSLALFASLTISGRAVTRSSLLGYTVEGVGAGLSLPEAVEALDALRRLATEAAAEAGRSLAELRHLHGAIRVHVSGALATVTITLTGGEVGPRDEEQAEATVVLALRRRGLEAERVGRGRVEAWFQDRTRGERIDALYARLDASDDDCERAEIGAEIDRLTYGRC